MATTAGSTNPVAYGKHIWVIALPLKVPNWCHVGSTHMAPTAASAQLVPGGKHIWVITVSTECLV